MEEKKEDGKISFQMVKLKNGNEVGVGKWSDETAFRFYNKEKDRELTFTISKEATEALGYLIHKKVFNV